MGPPLQMRIDCAMSPGKVDDKIDINPDYNFDSATHLKNYTAAAVSNELVYFVAVFEV